ncbi:MAG: enoyl-CoA hydratase-related protein [Anaerolineales bacterium]
MKAYQLILTEIIDRVGLITLNRPDSYNALNSQILEELMNALQDFDRQEEIGVMVITGSEKAFAAGADISAMVDRTPEEMRQSTFIPTFALIQEIKKPIIAAVSGYCLGGGAELAMSCDMITASESAKFGQPEINLGIIPGAGGTQRLTRAVGKVLAMEMILNNRTLRAEEALSFGLINHVYPVDQYLEQTLQLAREIGERAPLAIQAAKGAINASYQMSLQEGLLIERELFYDLFSTKDQQEGMNAFLEKREARWLGE